MKSSRKKPLPLATVTTFGISYPTGLFLVSDHSAATQILVHINQHLNETVHCGNGSLIKILYSAVLLLYNFKVISFLLAFILQPLPVVRKFFLRGIYMEELISHSLFYVNQHPFGAQLFEGRLALNPGLNLTWVSFSCVQKHFLG